MERQTTARFSLGDVVQRRDASFRGVVIDIDPSFDDRVAEAGQPFYRILAVGPDGGFTAYTREDDLIPDSN
ncbi:hemimethylated DNA-binding YccV-like domain-containing protein [Brevundimonas sp.]|uniref:hemimethylated DNA-binding YccV-like domain-containing protein n=1 Tax=Brevundimonas sp. TaxID=1871086 RepID=UPI003563AE78